MISLKENVMAGTGHNQEETTGIIPLYRKYKGLLVLLGGRILKRPWF